MLICPPVKDFQMKLPETFFHTRAEFKAADSNVKHESALDDHAARVGQ